jgi:hypothetical protein
MSMADPDTTLEILKDIRDEIRGARNELRDEIRGVRTERLKPPLWRRGKAMLAVLGAVAVVVVVLLAFRGGEQKGEAQKGGVPQVAGEAAARPAPSIPVAVPVPVPASAASMPDPPMPVLAATPATSLERPAPATPAARPAPHPSTVGAPKRVAIRHKARAPEAELEPAKL